ncbi:MAG: histidine ammonia-lyase, partial [Pseudomonadota bacterium]
MRARPLSLDPGNTKLDVLFQACAHPVTVAVPPKCWSAIDAAHATVKKLCDKDHPTYGINTGFGKLANQQISSDKLTQLQHNLLLSHCCGVGKPLDDAVVRLMMVLKVLSLARGFSGVRRLLIDHLIQLINADVLPVIPEKGSVGASGDLAPLAHMSAVLIGVGETKVEGHIVSAKEGLKAAGLEPLVLAPKEGLALINGTQASTALCLHALFRMRNVFTSALVTGAMSVDAMKGSDAPFDPRIHTLRSHPGQIEVARIFRKLLGGSSIRASHLDCEKVQDPYSLRCQPQVMGAVLDSMIHAQELLFREANAVTDNPLVFSASNEALSGGNFHAEPVGLVADQMAVAISEIGSIAERRVANLVDPTLSLLPPFLVDEPGLNSGFMIAQVTTAALASENKTLSHPASVDSLPTSANQEDHVSMATYAARRLGNMLDNLEHIIAIELLAAAQAIEFHRPTTSSDAIEAAVAEVRGSVSRYETDRYFAKDIETAASL